MRRGSSLRMPSSAVLYRGPSMLDGSPIIVVATGIRRPSKNSKTGRMVQTWIMRDDVAPNVAARNGDDASVCGDCPHRLDARTGHRTCYVTVHQAPLSVWRARNAMPMANMHVLAYLRSSCSVRMGAYGDPAAVPMSVWRSVVDASRRAHTGYTHAWRNPIARELSGYVMASADSLRDAVDAHAAGWRTFRVAPVGGMAIGNREIHCRSVRDGVTCAECTLCVGGTRGPNVVIEAHGSGRLHVLQ